jgi:hypothetical protein
VRSNPTSPQRTLRGNSGLPAVEALSPCNGTTSTRTRHRQARPVGQRLTRVSKRVSVCCR